MPVRISTTWVVYILRCFDDTLYTGATNNIHNRLSMHNSGKGAKYTRHRLPVKLVALFPCDNKSEALKLECKIKKMSREKKLELCFK